MRIAVLQLTPTEPEKARRLTRVAEHLDAAADAGAELVCLPEVWTPGYGRFDRWAVEAEPIPGPLTDWLAGEARRLGCLLHGGTMIERDGDRLYNTAVMFDADGRLLARYRKVHLFGHSGRERELVAAGDKVVTVEAGWGRLGLATCYDLRFPEMFRVLVDRGATALLVAAAWRVAAREDWRLLCRTRALENQCHLIAAAVSGAADGLAYSGHSLIVDPWGGILAEAGEDETVLTAEIDPADVNQARRDFPVLDDRVLRP